MVRVFIKSPVLAFGMVLATYYNSYRLKMVEAVKK